MINYSNLRVDSEAAYEILEAFEWYERKSDGLGKRFYNEVEQAIKKIQQNPFAFAGIKRNSNIRRVNLTHFPYKIFYDPSKEPMRVIAIVHTSRSPKYIARRMK